MSDALINNFNVVFEKLQHSNLLEHVYFSQCDVNDSYIDEMNEK